MKVVVTGAAGFLGARVAALLASEDSPLPVSELLLSDALPPPAPAARAACRVRTSAADLARPAAAVSLIDERCDVVFHLAAVVSGHAEANFDLGLTVNFDATRNLLEAVRRRAPGARFVFASTVGVFGGDLPPVLDDRTATTPQTSYGTAKAMCELLINDYSRRGFVDGRAVRLPTVTVRAGAANRAASSFASGIVREPLAGEQAVCPVAPEQRMWVCSPAAAVRNVVHAATLPRGALGAWRALALPGLSVSAREMVAALREAAGDEVAARVRFERDERVAAMVAGWPVLFDASRALRLGFVGDTSFVDIIRAYIRCDLKQ